MEQKDNRYIQRKKMYERRRQIKKARRIFFLVSFIVILILAGIITFFIELITGGTQEQNTESNDGASSMAVSSSSALQDSSGLETDIVEPQQPLDEQHEKEQTFFEVEGTLPPFKSKEITYTVPDAEMYSVVQNGRVTADYFSNVTFIGDSLLQNLKLHFGDAYAATYLAYYNAKPSDLISKDVTTMDGNTVNAIDDIKQNAKKNVYIQLGADTLDNLDNEEFLNSYEELIITLKAELSAETVFYIQGIAPVTNSKAMQSESYSNERIKMLNDEIAAIAYYNDVNYIDVFTALCDESFNLREEYASGSGGVQLNEAGSLAWIECIITHTAYESGGPYEAGSPYI